MPSAGKYCNSSVCGEVDTIAGYMQFDNATAQGHNPLTF